MPVSIRDTAAETADFPAMCSVFSVEPFLGFVQIFEEQFFIRSRGHDFQGLTVDLMQHSSVNAVIEDKSVSLSDELCQFGMAFNFSHGEGNYLSEYGVESRQIGH